MFSFHVLCLDPTKVGVVHFVVHVLTHWLGSFLCHYKLSHCCAFKKPKQTCSLTQSIFVLRLVECRLCRICDTTDFYFLLQLGVACLQLTGTKLYQLEVHSGLKFLWAYVNACLLFEDVPSCDFKWNKCVRPGLLQSKDLTSRELLSPLPHLKPKLKYRCPRILSFLS